jgi:hypothetical protein
VVHIAAQPDTVKVEFDAFPNWDFFSEGNFLEWLKEEGVEIWEVERSKSYGNRILIITMRLGDRTTSPDG